MFHRHIKDMLKFFYNSDKINIDDVLVDDYFAQAFGIEWDNPSQYIYNLKNQFKSWAILQQHCQDYEKIDIELVSIFEIFNIFGINQILKILNQHNDNDNGIQVCTCHKAKGLEWKKVIVAPDYFSPLYNTIGRFKFYDSEELRLLYVAITRAKNIVYIPQEISTFIDMADSCKRFSQDLQKGGLEKNPFYAQYCHILSDYKKQANHAKYLSFKGKTAEQIACLLTQKAIATSYINQIK